MGAKRPEGFLRYAEYRKKNDGRIRMSPNGSGTNSPKLL